MFPPTTEIDTAVLERKAAEVAGILRALANERRLMILCKLVEWGEATVGTLADAVGLSPSALSQHLAKMRDENLVAFRREFADALVPDRRSAHRAIVLHPASRCSASPPPTARSEEPANDA